jgi:hypothetical protein
MAKRLTFPEKRRLLLFLRDRDGLNCYLCGIEFKNLKEPIIEHLDNNWSNNNWDNLALAHQSCNIKKANGFENYADIADDKLEENTNGIFVGETFFEKEESKDKETSTEITISNKCYETTEEYLTDEILKNGWILYKETVPEIVYLCRQKIQHGSIQSIRSHIQTLTTKLSPFEITKNKKGKKIIKKRKTF